MAQSGRAAMCRPPRSSSVDLGEVRAHGIVAVKDGGVRVGDDPADDGVGEDFLVHPVVPLVGRELRAVDRRVGLVPPVNQGVELLDLLPARRGQERVYWRWRSPDYRRLCFDANPVRPMRVVRLLRRPIRITM